MVRFVVAMVAVLCLSVAVHAQNTVQPQGAVQMQSTRGVVKAVDNKSLTMTMGTTEKKLELAPNCRVFTTTVQGGRLIRRRGQTVMTEMPLANLQPNTQILCTTEIRNGVETVTQIRVEGTVGTTIIR